MRLALTSYCRRCLLPTTAPRTVALLKRGILPCEKLFYGPQNALVKLAVGARAGCGRGYA